MLVLQGRPVRKAIRGCQECRALQAPRETSVFLVRLAH